MMRDPVQELALARRLRVRRDECGDYQIIGRRGEVFWYGPDRLGVQIGGTPDCKLSERGAATLIRRLVRAGWEVSQRGDSEAVFILPLAKLDLALRTIGVFRKRPVPAHLPPTATRFRRTEARNEPKTGERMPAARPSPNLAVPGEPTAAFDVRVDPQSDRPALVAGARVGP